MSATYLLDANLFIEGWKNHYPFAMLAPLWREIADAASQGKLISLRQVRNEIKFPPELVRWVETELDKQFFMDPTEAASEMVEEVLRVVRNNPRYAESDDYPRFCSGADPFLIAAAKVDGYVLVTYEIPETRQSGPDVRIKIPDVCAAMGVRCITPSEMFVELGIRVG